MNRCKVKESKDCDSQTRHLEDVGWVCEPCYYWLRHGTVDTQEGVRTNG